MLRQEISVANKNGRRIENGCGHTTHEHVFGESLSSPMEFLNFGLARAFRVKLFFVIWSSMATTSSNVQAVVPAKPAEVVAPHVNNNVKLI